MNIAYDHVSPPYGSLSAASATDAQVPGMYAYTSQTLCKTCGHSHKAKKWMWRRIKGHRHVADWYCIASREEGLDLLKRAKKRWVGKGSLLVQWYGNNPVALSIFFVPKRKAESVNTRVPDGYPTKV